MIKFILEIKLISGVFEGGNLHIKKVKPSLEMARDFLIYTPNPETYLLDSAQRTLKL